MSWLLDMYVMVTKQLHHSYTHITSYTMATVNHHSY